MQITAVNVLLARAIPRRQLKALEAVAEYIAVPSVLLGPVQRPVRVFKNLVVGVAGIVFRKKADSYAACDYDILSLKIQLAD